MLASMRIDRLYGTSSAADKAFSGAAAPAAVPVAPVAVVFSAAGVGRNYCNAAKY